jgi:ribosome maturation factor RimP
MPLKESTTEEIRAIAQRKGCRLLAVENAGAGRFSVLRVVLERAGGEPVTVDDCEAVSREVSALLDSSDEIAHRYTLEVSSAGLERKIYSLEDAQRFSGRAVKVRTVDPIVPTGFESEQAAGPPARNFRGRLDRVEGDRLTIVDEENRRIYNVRFGDIRVARLEYSWPGRMNEGERVPK